jgi:hypothetical protein
MGFPLREIIAALLIGLLVGYLGSRYGPLAPNVRTIVDTQVTIVHAVDSSENVRRDFDASAKREIGRLQTTATLHQLDAASQRKRADSLASLTSNLSISEDSLRGLVSRERIARQEESASLHLALDAVIAARDSALHRWQVADSSARSLTNELHAALDRLLVVAHQAKRCGLGLGGPLGVTDRGVGLGLAGGVVCRI